MNLRNKKKLLSLITAGTIMLGFTGCSDNKPLLHGTILEGAIVFNADDNIIIGQKNYESGTHAHYTDVVSGADFAMSNSCKHPDVEKRYYNLEDLGLISNYLTEDELKKASTQNLTKDDIIGIVTRIMNEEKEEYSYTKKLTGK